MQQAAEPEVDEKIFRYVCFDETFIVPACTAPKGFFFFLDRALSIFFFRQKKKKMWAHKTVGKALEYYHGAQFTEGTFFADLF